MKTKLLIAILSLVVSTSYGQVLNVNWTQQAGYPGWDYTNDLLKYNNHYFLGGSLRGVVPGDTTQSRTANSNNAWISKYDTLGNLIWEKSYGGQYFDNISSITSTDQTLIVAGLFQDTLWYGLQFVYNNKYSGGYWALINEDGQITAVNSIGNNACITNLLVTSNESEIVYLVGSFRDSLALEGEGLSKTGDKGIFLTSISSNGTVYRPQIFKCTGESEVTSISCNDSSVIVAGTFSDTLFIQDTSLTSNGDLDSFLAMFNHNGELIWVQSIYGMDDEIISAVKLSRTNEVAIIGNFSFSTICNNSIIHSNGFKDIFVIILNSNGSVKWIKGIGGDLNDYGYAITEDEQCSYIISGSVGHTIHLNGQFGNIIPLESFSPFGNSFIAKFDSLGSLKASFTLPGNSEDYCRKILPESSNRMTVIGNFFGTLKIPTLTLDTISLISHGEKDTFILQFFDPCDTFSFDAGSDTSFCNGITVLLTTDQSFETYQWTPGGTVNQSLEVDSAGIYYLIAQNDIGCVSLDSIFVSENQFPVVFAGNDTIISPEFEINLGSAYSLNYNSVYWSSTGSGSFDNCNELNPKYNFSNIDFGANSINLILQASNNCGTLQDSVMISFLPEEDGIFAFPNPTNGLTNFVGVEGLSLNYITVLNQYGTIISGPTPINSPSTYFDLTPYPPGTYWFSINTILGVVTKQIEKQ
ncbi:MAG: T9SS type A sorting domain-containing protein [Bacteroidales bacterium]|nr:T9SS type A sorting domain-containing protein [Bacteroidales bacterium]